MNIKEIKEILNLMREHGLSEIELEKEGIKLRLKKMGSGQIVAENFQTTASGGTQQPGAGRTTPMQNAVPQEKPAASGYQVKSPMVGTFYGSPAPDQPPYVTVGQTVREGDVLCIVEAMKLMNEIKSDVSGVVEEVIAKSGEPVEFDQPLFRIKVS